MNVGEIEATLKLRDEMTAQLQNVNKQVAEVGHAFETFSSVSSRSIADVTVDLANARAKVSELMKLIEEADPARTGFIATLKMELNDAIPKVAMLETELSGMKTIVHGTGEEVGFFGKSLEGAAGFLETFGITMGAVGLVEFGKSLVEGAENLERMSEKTGFSIGFLQQMKLVGDETGTSVDQMARAFDQFQNRMEQGSTQFTDAMDKLGLGIAQIKAMTPDEQFQAIAKAIEGIEDPAERTRVAIELFGRSGAEILPALRKGFEDTKDAVGIMSDETVKDLAEAQHQVSKWWDETKGILAEAIVGFVHLATSMKDAEGLQNLDTSLDDNTEHLKKLGEETKKEIQAAEQWARERAAAGEVAGLSKEQIADLHKEMAEAAKEEAEYSKRVNESTAAGQARIDKGIEKMFTDMMKDQERQLKLTNAATVEYVNALTKLRALQEEGFSSNLKGIENVGEKVSSGEIEREVKNWTDMTGKIFGPFIEQARQYAKPVGEAFTDGFHDGLQALPSAILGAIQGGGSVISAAGSEIGGSIGKEISKSLSTSIANNFSGVTKSILGGLADMIPGIGSLLGPAITALFNIGGPSKAELAGRDIVSQFEGQFSSVEDMINQVGEAYIKNGRSAEEAQRDIKAMWDAEKQGSSAAKSALDVINQELNKHKSVMDAISAAGFKTKDSLAAAASQAKAVFLEMRDDGEFSADDIKQAFINYEKAAAAAGDETAAAWLKTHDAVDKGATQVDKVLDDLQKRRDGLAQSIQDEAPEEVMGVIETAQRAELANLDKQIEDQKRKNQETADQAADDLESALNSVHPDPVHVPIVYDFPPRPGSNEEAPEPVPGEGGGEPLPQAEGGDYLVTQPTLFLAGEAGPERATFQPTKSSTGSGSSDASMAAMLMAMDAKNDAFLMSLKRTIRDALLKSG